MNNRVIITGPECSGKTTLTRALADCFGVPSVEEYARIYLTRTDEPYGEEDLLHIAKKQHEMEQKISRQVDFPVLCDTSMLVLKIWSMDKFGQVHPWIENAWQKRTDFLHILCKPDFSWESDPLREDPGRRDELFSEYLRELADAGVKHYISGGNLNDRLKKAVQWIEDYRVNM